MARREGSLFSAENFEAGFRTVCLNFASRSLQPLHLAKKAKDPGASPHQTRWPLSVRELKQHSLHLRWQQVESGGKDPINQYQQGADEPSRTPTAGDECRDKGGDKDHHHRTWPELQVHRRWPEGVTEEHKHG